MILSLIVAISENKAIGKNNQLLWHLPGDLKFFKNTTSGKAIIMGRKTYESIGRPLPNRRNIVISSQADLRIDGCETVTSLTAAIDLCRQDEEAIIIGGGSIYEQALGMCTKMYLTKVHHVFEADTFFPPFEHLGWKEISREDHPADEKNPYPYSFIILTRD